MSFHIRPTSPRKVCEHLSCESEAKSHCTLCDNDICATHAVLHVTCGHDTTKKPVTTSAGIKKRTPLKFKTPNTKKVATKRKHQVDAEEEEEEEEAPDEEDKTIETLLNTDEIDTAAQAAVKSVKKAKLAQPTARNECVTHLEHAVKQLDATPKAEKTPAEQVSALKSEAEALRKKAAALDAEVAKAERNARLTPPFELYHGAVICGESMDVFANRLGTFCEPDDDDDWFDVNNVEIDSDRWKWCTLSHHGPLYLCKDLGDSSGFTIYRYLMLLSNDPKPIPVNDEPLKI